MPARPRAVRPLSPRVEALEVRLTPANFAVTSFLDNTVANDNLVTLREAITSANGNNEADVITFDASLTGKSITLGGTQLPTVTKDVTITGLGAKNLFIDADSASRVLQIAAGATVSISDLSIGNSKVADTESGGAILNSGTLTVDRSIVITNFAGTGAGIFNDGNLTVNGSLIGVSFASKNGGGIANAGILAVNNTTFDNDFANLNGGGIFNTGTATVRNATFVANIAGADGKNNATLGGGIFNEGTFTLLNSIVAGNLRGTADTPDDIEGKDVTADSVGNVIGSSAADGGLQDGAQNVVGIGNSSVRDVATIVNPTLDFNGGPTPTRAIVAGSVAIDKGIAGAGGFAFDQRGPGFARSFGAGVDAGAFELQSAPVLVVDNAGDADDGDFSAGQLTLREALRLNNDPTAGVTTITFSQSLDGKTITLGGTQLPTVTDDVTITGPGANLLAIDGAGKSRILQVAAGKTVNVSGLRFQNGTVPGVGNGGAIFTEGKLTITDGLFTSNAATLGGAIANAGDLVVTGSTFTSNMAPNGNGGAIANLDGTAAIVNSTISGNRADGKGGGIFSFSTLKITHGTIVLNVADARGGSDGVGGGIASTAPPLLINTIVAGNTRGTGATPDDLNATADTDSVGNVIGDAATAGGLTNLAGINVVGAPVASVVNVNLADNGGPTRTHAIVAGSPALGLGFDNKSLDADGKTLAIDQRGLIRPVVSLDAGAVENQFVTIAPATLPAGVIGTAFTQTLTATGATGPFTFTATGTLPPGLTLSPAGTLSGTPTAAGAFDFVVTATAASGDFVTQAFTVTITAAPVVARTVLFEVGGDEGSGTVRVFNVDGTERFVLTPFGANFTGGVRVATGDLNGDGVDDLVVGTGPGVATRVLAFDGVTQAQLMSIEPFESKFLGGVFVSVGDIDGDGNGDVLISPDQGGGPRVRVFSGKDSSQIDDFFGIDDPNFRGGARTATGDVNGDGRADVLVAAGIKGGPRVAVFDGKGIGSTRVKLFDDFFIFEQSLRNGAFIASGDIDGDGFAEVIGGGGPGGGPRIFALSGKDLLTNAQVPVANFFAGDETNRGGIRIVAKDIDGDAFADILAGDGTGAGSRVTTFLGKDTSPNGTPVSEPPLTAFEGFTNGVFVG